MKIAIFETYHFEVAHTLISLFDKAGNEITIFVYPEAYRQLLFILQDKADKYNWVVRKKDETNRGFIRRMFRYTKGHSFDLLYFNTIGDNFIIYVFYLRKLRNIPAILTLHDINGHFQYNPSLSVARLVRYIGKRLLIKRFQSFNVLAESMVNYLKEKLPAEKKVFSIPGNYFLPTNITPIKLETGEPIKIVIPGSVDERRRDYSIVKGLLEATSNQSIAIEICLLGAFRAGYSENTHRFCLNYLRYKTNLKIFEEEIVDQPKFDKQIQESHFVLMPVQPTLSIADGIMEEYGKSICSGNIGDVIKHAKPFFIPRSMPLDDTLQGSAIRYDSLTDILSVIKQLSPSVYCDMQKKAWMSSLHYTKENIIGRNAAIFL